MSKKVARIRLSISMRVTRFQRCDTGRTPPGTVNQVGMCANAR